MNFHELADECIVAIFSKLNFPEQLNMARVCKRFQDIISLRIWKETFNKLNTHHYHGTVPAKYRVLLLHLTAANLERLIISRWAGVYDDFYCLDLRSFLCTTMRNLVYLQFRGNRIVLTDSHMQLVAKCCPQLKFLYISDRRITGAHIESMRNVEELHATHCSIEAKHLRLILFNLKLKRLNLAYNAYNVESVFYNAAISQLQYLQLSDAVLYGIQLAEYLSLREMVINNSSNKLFARHATLELKHYTNFARRLKSFETNVPLLTKSMEIALSSAKSLKQIALLHDDAVDIFADILENCAYLELLQIKLYKYELQFAGTIVQKQEKKWQRIRSSNQSKQLELQVLYPDKIDSNMHVVLMNWMYDNLNISAEYDKVTTKFQHFDELARKFYDAYKIDFENKEYFVKYVFN